MTIVGWKRPASLLHGYLRDQANAARMVFVAFDDGRLAGYVTVVGDSEYLPFSEAGIPEIRDLNVLPDSRKRGTGTKLLREAEKSVSAESAEIGISVGLDSGYGAAQRLYVLHGNVPDGRGILWRNRFPAYGEEVRIDDDLNLHLIKELK